MASASPQESRKGTARWRMSRRRFIISLGFLGFAGYGFGVETGWFDVTHKTVKMGKWTSGKKIRILHLSDLHASFFVSWRMLKRAFADGLATKPDLILLTGDFVTHQTNIDRYIEVLKPLAATVPAYACFGNHDGGRWAADLYEGYSNTDAIEGMLRKSGIIPLRNEHALITVAGQEINLIGVGDLYNGDVKPHKAFQMASKTGGLPTIVLSHNPDTKDYLARWPWELMLSGHTHGGQIKIPGYGPIMVPIHDRTFAEGLHYWKNRYVHVTRGVGNLMGIRFNCRPEISVLDLTG